jgi:hypothetical protein
MGRCKFGEMGFAATSCAYATAAFGAAAMTAMMLGGINSATIKKRNHKKYDQ